MPGPRNQKKKKQSQPKKDKKVPAAPTSIIDSPADGPQSEHCRLSSPTSAAFTSHARAETAPPASQEYQYHALPISCKEHIPESSIYPHHTSSSYSPEEPNSPPIPSSLLKTPFIHDPGSGPRVKDTRAFLASRFASPPSLDDPLCAEFAEEAVTEMLCSVLPDETALILWYNKSRRISRICPACQRLYRLGDVLPEHLSDRSTEEQRERQRSPYLAKEQALSGLCSPICFILAAYNYPGAIRSTWGRMAEELDDATWDLLDGPGQNANDMGLGMLVKMTRCHDLGLGQLFFPDLDLESDATAHEPDSEREDLEESGKGGKWNEDDTIRLETFEATRSEEGVVGDMEEADNVTS